MEWTATQYVTFEEERTRPVRDLIARIPNMDAQLCADLGCGPGNSTQVLSERFADARIIGVDSSAAMVDAARARLPAADFVVADIAAWDAPDGFDVILANASLHWVGDHRALFPRLAAKLAPGGSLAVQLPDNLAEPAQTIMRDLAWDGPWAATLAGLDDGRTHIESAAWYYGVLRAHCAHVEVWRTTYYHRLSDGLDGVVDWFKGTGLLPFLAPLTAPDRDAFLQRYRAALARAYPVQADGSVLLAMPRLFLVATR
jgi:trans-aconitate 2-methyltransferase